MGSRIRSNTSQLFVCWCEIVGGDGPDQPPWIIQKFPNTYDDAQTLKAIPQFVFPCSLESNVVQNFSFVLTSIDSTFTFGFCRHTPNSKSAIVLLSHLPWDNTFYKILNQCAELLSSESPDDVWPFLQSVYQSPLPDPGTELCICYPPKDKTFVVKCNNHTALPSIPDDRNLLEYYNAVDADNMMLIFASMLFERRILISSRHLHRLSSCVQAANSLLYPMTWQHIYIPVMPESLLDYLLAPMPFLIGVPHSLMDRVRLDEVGEVVYLNADTNTITTPFNDLNELPSDVISYLKRKLNQPNQGMGDALPRAFLRALVMLIGNYRDALQLSEADHKVTFNEDKFIAGRPSHVKNFVVKMLELQIFTQFLEERLELINKGEATSDEFEMEVNIYGDKPSRKNYQHLMHAVRKEGGAFVKTIRNKTNPAMKSAVKSVSKGGKQVKEKSQEKYKEIKGKMKLPSSSKTPEHSTTWTQEPELRSAPSSPVSSKRPVTSPYDVVSTKMTYRRANTVLYESSKRDYQGTDTRDSTGLDLMGELEQEISTRLPEPTNQTVPPPRPPSMKKPSSRPPAPPTSHHNGVVCSSDNDSGQLSKDEDLIVLGSPQDEEFDPLFYKSVVPEQTNSGKPMPVHSFLHSRKSLTSSPQSLPSHISLGPTPKDSPPQLSSSTLPLNTSPLPLNSSSFPLNTPSLQPNSSPLPSLTSLQSQSPSLPLPVRKGSSYRRNPGSTIPSSTMAGLPAALQNHLANKVSGNAINRSLATTPMVPFSSLQSTSAHPPTMQTNPVYNNHLPPFSQRNINNNNDSSKLLSDFSSSFQKMSMNKESEGASKGQWTAFD